MTFGHFFAVLDRDMPETCILQVFKGTKVIHKMSRDKDDMPPLIANRWK